MTIKEELANAVRQHAVTLWSEIPNATVVPSVESIAYGNTGKYADVTILYADISASTQMVDQLVATRAAESYKSFLLCASKIITKNNGTIQAYDGDRVMAVYIGESQADDAVSTALELHCAVQEIINPAYKQVYGDTHRELQFTVGIDSGKCLVVRVGVRGVGELAWIGPAANYAAKLNSFNGLDHSYPIRITSFTYAKLTAQSLLGANGVNMWEGAFGDYPVRNHYRTKFLRVL